MEKQNVVDRSFFFTSQAGHKKSFYVLVSIARKGVGCSAGLSFSLNTDCETHNHAHTSPP